jgi:hypothetical protein
MLLMRRRRVGLLQKGDRVLPADLLALIKAPPRTSTPEPGGNAVPGPAASAAPAAASVAAPTSAALPFQAQV